LSSCSMTVPVWTLPQSMKFRKHPLPLRVPVLLPLWWCRLAISPCHQVVRHSGKYI
jgi:hypothetical protein